MAAIHEVDIPLNQQTSPASLIMGQVIQLAVPGGLGNISTALGVLTFDYSFVTGRAWVGLVLNNPALPAQNVRAYLASRDQAFPAQPVITKAHYIGAVTLPDGCPIQPPGYNNSSIYLFAGF